MPTKPTILAKRTKAEIITEYDKLVQELDQARTIAQTVHEPRSQALINKAKQATDNHEQQISQSITKARTEILDHFNALAESISTEVKRLDELWQAAEAVQNSLAHYHHIEVAADTFEVLVADNELKKQQFAIESARRQTDLDSKLAAQEQQWNREQEEKTYQARRKRQHEGQEHADQMAQRENALQKHQDQLDDQTKEIQNLQQQVADIPKQLQIKLDQQAKELTAQLNGAHAQEKHGLEQGHKAALQVLEIRIDNQQDLIKRQQVEITALRKETDQATKRAQDLAVTIIKHQPQPDLDQSQSKPQTNPISPPPAR